LVRERDVAGIDRLSARYFASERERGLVKEATEQLVCGEIDVAQWERVFAGLAAARTNQQPFRIWVFNPVCRFVFLWVDMRRVGNAKPFLAGDLVREIVVAGSVSPPTRQRLTEYLVSDGAYLLHWAYLLLFAVSAFAAVRMRRPVALAVLFGVFLYTASGALLAVQEARRSLVFYPAILFLLSYWDVPRHRGKVEESQSRKVEESQSETHMQT
jgi:hypothetical protein